MKNILTVVTVVISSVLILLNSSVTHPFLEKINLVIILLILLCTSELWDKTLTLSTLEERIDEINKKLGKSDILQLRLINEGYEYLASMLSSINQNDTPQIKHVSMAGRFPKTSKNLENLYHTAFEKSVRSNKVRYRHISMIGNDDGYRYKRMIRLLEDPEIYQYYVAYYEKEITKLPAPHFSFIVFNDEEVCAYYPPIYSEIEHLYVFRNKELVKMYTDYFMNLWDGAIKVDKSNYKKKFGDRFGDTH